MLQKKEIETMLTMNGVALDANEAEIRAVFERARYNAPEIDTMLDILRGTIPVQASRLEGIQKSMRMDKPLKPGDVAELLGIDMDVDVDEFGVRKSKIQKMTFGQMVIIVVVSLIIVGGGLYAAMYYTQIGEFHPTSTHLIP